MCLFCFWLILVIWFAFHSDLPTLSTLVNHWWHDCQALMHSPVVLIFDGRAWNQWQILQKTCNAQDVPGALWRNIFVFHARAHKFSLGPYLVFEFVTLYLKTNFCSLPFFFCCSVSLMFLFFSLLCLKRGLEMNYFLRASVSITSIDRRDRGKSWPKRVALDDMAPTRDCQFFQGDSLN